MKHLALTFLSLAFLRADDPPPPVEVEDRQVFGPRDVKERVRISGQDATFRKDVLIEAPGLVGSAQVESKITVEGEGEEGKKIISEAIRQFPAEVDKVKEAIEMHKNQA